MSAIKILLIDDNENLIDGLETVLGLNMDDAEIFTSYTGMGGLKLAIQHRPHIVFLDMNLPDIQGGQVLQEIRKRGIPCKVIMLTGDDKINSVQGADGYMKKPIKPSQLLGKISQMLD